VVWYLDQQSRINALHYYPYILLEGLHRVLNKCGVRSESLYVRPLIGRAYACARDSLAKLASEKPQRALACDQRSTFVMAEKAASIGLSAAKEGQCKLSLTGSCGRA
jgi:hypothetical protein